MDDTKKNDMCGKAERIRESIENILGCKLDVYQIRDICDILYIEEYPTDVQTALDEEEFSSEIWRDIEMAKDLGKSLEEFYQMIIDQMVKDNCSEAGLKQQKQYTDLALNFYYGHPEQFGQKSFAGSY